MTPLTANFVKQLVVASKQQLHCPLSPEEVLELAHAWLSFHAVLSAITQPKEVTDTVEELYLELAKSLAPNVK